MRNFTTAILLLIVLTGMPVLAQTVLFSENFNGANPPFSLNTSDVGGVSGGGSNRWVINNVYAGGSFDVICLGIPLPAAPLATPNQPGGVTGGPQSNYLHITSTAGQQGGVANCHFVAADGFCNFTESYFAAMNTSVSTVGQTGVSLSFWWLCDGLPGNSYGEVYYSTNNGTTWNVVPGSGEFSGNPNWTQTTLTNAVFDNQANLRIGFRFETIESFSAASDPGFGVDEISLFVNTQTNNSITTGNLLPGPYCPGDVIQVPYTVTGTFNPGNTFTAQLSDAGGSFFSPVSIGTLNATGDGTITATIPPGTPSGTGYVIRVTGSNPNVTGSISLPITVSAGPTSTIDPSSMTSVCAGGSAVLAYSGSPGSVQWLSSTNGVNFTPIAGATADVLTSPPINATTYFQVQVTTNCGTSTSPTWTVNLSNNVTIPLQTTPNTLNLCNGPITVSTIGNFNNLVWSTGQSGPSAIVVTSPGAISVTGQDLSGCPASSAPINIIQTTPAALTVTPGNPIIFCGSPINLTASPGFASYQWSTGQSGPNLVISSMPTSPISISAVDNNGCNVPPVQVDVQQAGNVSVPVEPSIAAICDGEPATLTAAAGFNVYQWSNGAQGQTITVSLTGYYSVTVTDANGCTGTSPLVEVIQSQFPISNFSYTQNQGGYTINFNNTSQNGLTSTWLFDSLSTSPLDEPSFTFPESGPYYITLITENPCGADTVVKLVIVAQVGLDDVLSAYRASVYPNPSANDFNLALETPQMEKIQLILTDLNGRFLVEKTEWVDGTAILNIPGETLSAGLYLLHVRTNKGNSVVKLLRQ